MHPHPGITVTAIRWSLLRPKQIPGDTSPHLQLLYGLLTDPLQFADSDNSFSVILPGCSRWAAPFILFRLKRLGFSACRAYADDGGLIVQGRR